MFDLSEIPQVGEDDELRFVLHPEPDPRPFADLAGWRLRRGPGAVYVESGGSDGGWVNTTIIRSDGAAYLMGSVGQLLMPLWDDYQVRGIECLDASHRMAAPAVVTALVHRRVDVTFDDGSDPVALKVVPVDFGAPMATVTMGLHDDGRWSFEDLVLLTTYPARGALDLLAALLRLYAGTIAPPSLGDTLDRWFDQAGAAAAAIEAGLGRVNDVLSKLSGPS